ncbi:hypothetical protein ABZ471_28240 [Streptomyces sp. NPDC005728]|uniref:hypothetical protein n=1 Tax=Streptomyces sp. NPDC005728 TaxID=3157054 RepID=UPI0033CC9845
MAGVFTWIRQWLAGNGADPDTSAPEPEDEPEAAPEPEDQPETALEPVRQTAIVPGDGDVRPPREILPERATTDNDVRIFFLYAILGSDQGQKRFLKLLGGLAVIAVVLCVAVPLVTIAVHALVQQIAPGSAPSPGTMKWSVSGLAGVTAYFWGRRRIRAWFSNRSQNPAAPEPGTAPPAQESDAQQP